VRANTSSILDPDRPVDEEHVVGVGAHHDRGEHREHDRDDDHRDRAGGSRRRAGRRRCRRVAVGRRPQDERGTDCEHRHRTAPRVNATTTASRSASPTRSISVEAP
jgi:hypothetical protein